MRVSFWRWILLAALFGIVLRTVAVLQLPAELAAPQNDAATYNAMALSILEGEGMRINEKPVTWRGPIYPYFLTAVYGMFGAENWPAVRWIQVLLGGILIFLVGLLGKIWGMEREGQVAQSAQHR